MEKVKIRSPLPQKPLNLSSPKFARMIKSGTPTPMENFITIRLPPFRPINMRKCASSDSASFFRFSDGLQPRPLHRFSRSIRHIVVSRKDVPFGGPENKILHFDPIFPPKRKFFSNFRRDLENFASKRP